ncbi:hypothetical protein T492DRAFT_1131789 [Pavlovales sp. CCMP2436]|nr:hypothetical protein T492DRAFT_1131789 [Pavlovales sp. CCMP2436]
MKNAFKFKITVGAEIPGPVHKADNAAGSPLCLCLALKHPRSVAHSFFAMDETTPLRAAPILSPASPLSPLSLDPPAFTPPQREKRPLGHKDLNAFEESGQVGPGPHDERCGAGEAADECMNQREDDEQHGEDDGGHRSPLASPRTLAPATPEDDGQPKVARTSHPFDKFGFGHHEASSSEASPRRPMALLRDRAPTSRLGAKVPIPPLASTLRYAAPRAHA